jgi:hypothetical protein
MPVEVVLLRATAFSRKLLVLKHAVSAGIVRTALMVLVRSISART